VSPTSTRLLLVLASAALALALGRFVLVPLLSSEPPALVVVERTPEDEHTAAWRAEMNRLHPPVPIRAFDDTTLVRETLAEPTAARLYPQLRVGAMAWHPQVGFRRLPSQELRFAWPEHPAGHWSLTTNADGLRAPRELQPDEPLFVIVGDSHAEGACELEETFAGRLAADLEADPKQEPGLVVLNAASGGHSLHQYIGTLEDLAGDVPGEPVDPARPIRVRTLVVTVYGGNDFQEVLRLAHWFGHSERPPDWGRDNPRLAPWRATHMPAIAQAVEHALYFRNNPSEAELALAESLAIAEELQRHAERRGFRLLFLYLPSALETERGRHPEHFEALLADLELSDADLQGGFELGDRFLEGLGQLGVNSVDLRPSFRASPVSLFWERDLHLNLSGHERVAEAVLDWYRAPEEP
jgi:lysophospholipase L1-like esterase